MISLNPIHSGVFNSLDEEMLNKIYRSIPPTINIGKVGVRFRKPTKFEVCWEPPEGIGNPQKYIDAPLSVLNDAYKQPIEDIISMNDVSVKSEKSIYGYYDPALDYVCIFLGPLRKKAYEAVEYFYDLDFDQAYYSLVRKSILHELTHATFDYRVPIISNYRLSEGLANLIPDILGTDFDVALNSYGCMYQDIRYNYHFPLKYLSNLDRIIGRVIRGSYKEADTLFYKGFLEPNSRFRWEENFTLTVKGDVIANYFGFGGDGLNLMVGGNLDPICNISGTIIAANVKRIDGYLNPDNVAVVTNSKINGECYNVLKPKKSAITSIDSSKLDISKEIKSDNKDFQFYIEMAKNAP